MFTNYPESNKLDDKQVAQVGALQATEDSEPECYVCGSSESAPHNPLLPVTGFMYDDGSAEYVHLTCARNNPRYGFCWCCEAKHESKVFMAEAVNSAGECVDHAGESELDYPEADLESYIEYIQKEG